MPRLDKFEPLAAGAPESCTRTSPVWAASLSLKLFEAYSVLSQPARRRQYDRQLAAACPAGPGADTRRPNRW